MTIHRPLCPALALALAALCAPAPAAATDAAGTEPMTLDAVAVTDTRPAAVDSTPLKLPAKILETPRSLTVFDATRITEQDLQKGSDFVNWIPGVFSNGDSHHFYARGFRQSPNDWRVDGFSGYTGAYSTRLFGIESITALKGPAGLLYGTATSPGGLINLVTKKPRETAATTVTARVRTFAGGGVGADARLGGELEFDSTGPVTRDARLLYRLLASDNRDALPADRVTDRNRAARLAFTYKLDPAGRFLFTPSFERYEEAAPARNTTISPASSRATNDGRTDYTLADLGPRTVNTSAGRRIDEGHTFGFDFSARLTDSWRAQLSVNEHTRDYASGQWTVQTATLAQSVPADPRSWTVQRRHARAKADALSHNLDAHTSYEFPTGSFAKTTVQAGVNARLSVDRAYTFATSTLNQSPINLYTGSAPAPLVADVGPAYTVGNRTDTDQWNAYLQTRTRLYERWVLGLSGGHARQKSSVTGPAGVKTYAPDRSSRLTPNVSLVYLPTPKTSLYASFSTGYALADPTLEDAAGTRGAFDPTEGVSTEIGAKAELLGELLAATLSIFDTRLDGVLVLSDATDLNGNGNRFYRQLDSGRRAQGVELEFTLRPVRAWTTTLGYAYVDTFNRNADGSRGPRAEMTPLHSVTAYSRYTVANGPLRGLRLNLGAIWQHERIGGSASPSAAAPDPLWLRPFARLDTGLGYRWRKWNFGLNVENLLDHPYLVSGTTGLGLVLANPRTLSLRVSHTW